jgi:hypothetical protein
MDFQIKMCAMFAAFGGVKIKEFNNMRSIIQAAGLIQQHCPQGRGRRWVFHPMIGRFIGARGRDGAITHAYNSRSA